MFFLIKPVVEVRQYKQIKSCFTPYSLIRKERQVNRYQAMSFLIKPIMYCKQYKQRFYSPSLAGSSCPPPARLPPLVILKAEFQSSLGCCSGDISLEHAQRGICSSKVDGPIRENIWNIQLFHGYLTVKLMQYSAPPKISVKGKTLKNSIEWQNGTLLD